MTAVDDRSARLARASADFQRAVEYWRDRAGTAEQERDELGRRLHDSEERRIELEGLYAREVGAAATARAQLDAMRGNR